jgi:Bacterial PH domain
VSEFDTEPVRGLPERPPQGETILWQGTPNVRSLALRVFHLWAVGIYFALLLAWSANSSVSAGEPLASTLFSGASTLLVASAAMGLLVLLAWLVARNTVYTITNRRVVMRIGVALTITMNVPFSKIEGAGLKVYGDGTGDIPLTLSGPDRQSFVVLWPHVRPWRINRPEPMLRCVPDARAVATTLAAALATSARDRPIAIAAPHKAGAMPAPSPAAA